MAAPAAVAGKGGDVLEGKLLAAVHQQQHGRGAPGGGAGGVEIPSQDIPHQLLPYGGAPPAPLPGVGGGAQRGRARGGKRGGAGGRGGGKDGTGGKAGGGGAKGPKGVGPDGKPFVSHSVAEKQRRDRINTLIDELREIVPPQARGGDGVDGGSPTAAEAAAPLKENAKRPKHEVLADTISLMRRLLTNPDTMHIIKSSGKGGEGFMVDEWDGSNEDAVGLEAEEGGSPQEVADLEGGEVLISVRAGNGGAGSGSDGREGSANGSGGGEGTVNGTGKGTASVQKGGPASSDGGSNGSAPAPGSDRMTVTVKCADRYGLLHTLTSSLKSMGLRTQTAVVSTSADGIVKDTFKVDRASCALECSEIKATLLDDIIQGSSLTNTEPKRKRSSVDKGG